MRATISNMSDRRIAVIGFGFSGLMLTANLVKTAIAGTTIYIIANDLSAQGLAYGTTNTRHLLNVPAARMSAWADAPGDLLEWLKTPDAAMAKQRLKLTNDYTEADFIPRALYAAYLGNIWHKAQEEASERGVMLKLVEANATRIRTENELAVLTTRGDAIAVDSIVLACGNEVKPILPHLKTPHLIQNPWAADALKEAKKWASPVLLFGAGLTAVDTVLSLRKAGYEGDIIAVSRGGKWPHAHQAPGAVFQFTQEELFAQKNLRQLVHFVRTKIKETGEWRPVIDALRPYTHDLWKRFSARDQQIFIARLLSLWNVHRHRMAPEIDTQLKQEMLQHTLKLFACKKIEAQQSEDALQVTLQTATGAQHYTPSHIINCAGGELNLTRSTNPLLKQAAADHVLEPHANGLGVAVDPACRAWGAAHPHLYVIGSWMTGQWLESTAVPELRQQAKQIAAQLSKGL